MPKPTSSLSPSRPHKQKTEAAGAMLVRDVPEALRIAVRAKAAKEGLTLRAKLIELMSNYVKKG